MENRESGEKIWAKWEMQGELCRGTRHEKEGLLCQDRIFYRESDHLQAIALADGISKSNISVTGLEKILEVLCNDMLEEYGTFMKEREDVIQYSVMLLIRRQIEALMNLHHVSADVFASTILAVCIDTQRKSFCCIHLGDGVVVCKEKTYRILSYPVNGLRKNQTYLTTTEEAHRNIKIVRGSLQNISEIALLSDGTYHFPLSAEKIGKTLNQIRRSSGSFRKKTDDQSVIMLYARDDKLEEG